MHTRCHSPSFEGHLSSELPSREVPATFCLQCCSKDNKPRARSCIVFWLSGHLRACLMASNVPEESFIHN